MAALGVDPPFYRGDTYIFDGVAKISGVTIDLSLYTVWFSAKNNRRDTDADAVFILTSAGAQLVVNADQTGHKGEFTVTILPDDTLDIEWPATLQYDVQVKKTSTNEVSTADSGTLAVSLDVTRATT